MISYKTDILVQFAFISHVGGDSDADDNFVLML
jgi:hypothetical protein